MSRFTNIIVISLFFLSGCKPKKENDLIIATAANVQYAMKELIQTFHEETGIKANLVVGSSGKLTAQIDQGAPFDVFVSANLKYPNELHKKGLTTNKPEVYSQGRLVMWTMVGLQKPTLEGLAVDSISKVAIANPKLAPYGIAAVEAMKAAEVYDRVKDNLVYGESISQTNQFVMSKTVAVGFTSMSVVLSPEMKDKGKWTEVDKELYSPIEQGVVVIKRDAENVEKAEKFYQFLFSEKAKLILENYGYFTSL